MKNRGFNTGLFIRIFMVALMAILFLDLVSSQGEARRRRKKSKSKVYLNKYSMGDLKSGQKLFFAECYACHGWATNPGERLFKDINPEPPNLAYGGLMNKYSQESLLRLLEKGGEQFGKSKIMPAFSLNNQLNKMDLMDILEYLDSKSVSIKEHFPQAAEYTIKDYFISGSGLQRVESNIGDSFGQKKVKVTLATVFKGSGKVKKPRLVPQDNQELDKLNKQMKIGYVVYYHDMKVKGKSFPVELAINFMGKILRLELPDQQGLKMSRNIKRFKGYGNRNVRNVFKWRKRRDKRMQSLARSVYIAWLLGQEAIFLFEKEEKDRTWADEDF